MTFRREKDLLGQKNPVFESIAVDRRRTILAYLLDEDPPVTEQELEIQIARSDQEPSATETPTTDLQRIRNKLVHDHLPRLENAGLITWDRDDETIEPEPHPALEDPRFRLLVEATVEDLDKTLQHLASEPRRIVLTVLRDEQSRMSRTALARELLRRKTGESDPEPEVVDDGIVTLHHVHLPKLDTDDLIEYDVEAGDAEYTGHPALEEVFTIIYNPEERIVDAYDGFFEGLNAVYERLSQETSEETDWPHSWGDPYYG